MNPGLTLATTGRVLRQIRTDPRTIALIMVVPMVSIGLLAWIYNNTPIFDVIGPALLASAFARTEFQAVQFMPAFITPQFLLCGLHVDRDEMPTFLSALSDVLPLSYAVDAMKEVTTHSELTSAGVWSMVIVVGFIVLSLALAALTLSRRTP